MKNFFSRFPSPSPQFIHKEQKDILENLSQGTDNLHKNSVDFDQTVKKNIEKIVQNTSQEDAQNILEKNLSRENKEISENSETLQEHSEEKTTPSLKDSKEKKLSRGPKMNLLKKASVKVGTYVGVGAKYGALIFGSIGAVLSFPYGLAVAGAAGMSLAASLGVAILALITGGALGALEGALKGALIGAIVGFVKKAMDKKESPETPTPKES